MTFLKSSVINEKTYRLGRASHGRNTHEFDRVWISQISLHERSSLVKRSSLVRNNPRLLSHCQSYVLPLLFAQCLYDYESGDRVLQSGRRSVCLEDRVVLNLKELGWSQEPINQEFCIDVKGCGIKLRHAETITKEDVFQLEKMYGFSLPDNIDNELVFSRNKYMHFEIPEGAQSEQLAWCALKSSDYFSRYCFKIAPLICIITYPGDVQRIARLLDKENALNIRLAQEKRLMPSFVRAAYFEHNPGKNEELAQLISSDHRVLKSLPDVFLDDFAHYIEHLARTTRRDAKRKVYVSDFLADMYRIFHNPEKMLKKNYGWYIAKDWVVAQSGLYFVDLEASMPRHAARNMEHLSFQHQLYLTVLLKDFLRFFAHYNIAITGENNPGKQKIIEQESIARAVDRLNQSGLLRITQNNRSLNVAIDYLHINKQDYKIWNKDLPKVVA